MKISTSLIPEITWFTHFSECTIREAILYRFQHAKNNTLSLVDIGKIKVNKNKLLGSYWSAIRELRNMGYRIETVTYHHPKKKVTCVTYKLDNPLFNPDWTNF